MKVLFFNYEYPPLGGGAANATLFILREFSKMPGLEVDLVTSSVDKDYHAEKIGNNITIHRIPIGKNAKNLHFQSQRDLLVYAWKAYAFSKELLAKNHYDLSHSFFTVPCGFLSWRLKKKFNLPYIVSLRGSDVPGYSDRFPLLYVLLKPLIKIIWKNSSRVVANSQGLKELALKTKNDQEIGVIYNGIDTQSFKPSDDRARKEDFIVTPGASRVTDRKGLNYLIDAIAIFALKHPHIKLKIMGDGNARQALQKQVAGLGLGEKVEFLGRIPRERTAGYYQEADVFVLPSLNEGMSNAMLEALATGLPILATDTGGAKELVQEGANGFIIKTKDAKDIAQKLERLAQDPEHRKKMGEKSRLMALEMSWGKVADKYNSLYNEVKSA